MKSKNQHNKLQNLKRFKNPKGFRGRSAFTVQLWWAVQVLFFKPSPQLFYGWRRFILRAFGAKIGKKVIIRPTARITYPWKVSIGDFSWIGDEVVLYSLGNIKIGENTVISQRSYICTGTHDYNSEDFRIYAEDTNIGSKCWLATDVYVAPGITIKDGVVVGARSSVFSDLDANKVYVGSPAKSIKNRTVE